MIDNIGYNQHVEGIVTDDLKLAAKKGQNLSVTVIEDLT